MSQKNSTNEYSKKWRVYSTPILKHLRQILKFAAVRLQLFQYFIKLLKGFLFHAKQLAKFWSMIIKKTTLKYIFSRDKWSSFNWK